MRTFKEWTLAKLDKTFGLHQERISTLLDSWLTEPADISDFERQALEIFRHKLCVNVYDWNEAECRIKIIL